MATPQIFSPPASCFTSQYGLHSSTDSAAGTVYVTASVGCPLPSNEPLTITIPQLPECCGPFSSTGNLGGPYITASSQICPEGYGYVDAQSYAGATSAGCCPTKGGFTVDPAGDEFGLYACTIAPPSITATGTDYVTVTEIVAQTLSAGWNQQVLNALSITPNLSAAPSTTAATGTPGSTPTLTPTLSPGSTTGTPHSTTTHSASTLAQPAPSTSTSAGIGARARVGGLAIIGLVNFLW